MLQFNPDVIREIVSKGGAAELHRILLGISKYCVKGISHKRELSQEEGLLFVQSVHYLEFVTRHGLKQAQAVTPKGYIDSSHEHEFGEWLKQGAPGLIWDDVLAYLREHSDERTA